MTDEEQIKELYIRYWQYMIDKDADGLRSLQTDDYFLMHMTGVKQSREVFIRGLLNGTFNYYSAELVPVQPALLSSRRRLLR